MSSFELLELFGVTIDDPVMRTVFAWIYNPDLGGRELRLLTIPVDKKPERTIRVDFAPEDGVLAHGLRDGERSEWKQMLAQTANEAAVLRAGKLEGSDGESYGSRLFLPMWRIRELDDEDAAMQIPYDDEGGMSSLWCQP